MAFKSVCKDQKLPALGAEVTRIIETFAQSDHHDAFTLKYGRVVCDPFPGMGQVMTGPTFPPLLPGFERFIWSVYYQDLRAGMEIIFSDVTGYVACILKDLDNSGFTYSRGGVDVAVPLHEVDSIFHLFVESPGAYMRFVGRDRYTGDLTDLRPLKEGEEMSDLEQNIREFYEDRLDAANGEN